MHGPKNKKKKTKTAVRVYVNTSEEVVLDSWSVLGNIPLSVTGTIWLFKKGQNLTLTSRSA